MRRTFLIGLAGAAFICAARATDLTDFDGDGLPDQWEAAFGISTNSAEGLFGADGDPDGDGLSNMSEYLAGYTVVGGNIYSNYAWAVAGLNPTNAYSGGAGLSDYHRKASAAHAVTLGWMFSDRDYVDDAWETVATNNASRVDYDMAGGDSVTNGGWSAWDRCRADYALRPSPELRVRLIHRGPQTLGAVKLMAFSDLRTKPDAVYTVAAVNRRVLADLVSGALTPASRWWLAIPNDGAFQTDYPIGAGSISACGWDAPTVELELMPATPWLFAYTLPAPAAGSTEMNKTRARIFRFSVDGSTSYQMAVLDSTFDVQHTLSGLDYMVKGSLALDYGLSGVSTGLDRNVIVYNLYIGSASVLTNNQLALAFTNRNESTQFQAQPMSPVGGAFVYRARPEISWYMPEDYTAFSFELRKGATDGPLVYQSTDLKAPPRDFTTGYHVYDLPVYAGDTITNGVAFETGTNYFWRVAALNSKYTLSLTAAPAWSGWSGFRLAAGRPPSGHGLSALGATLFYAGAATNLSGKVKLQAFPDRSFTGAPAAQYTLAPAETIALTNGTPGVTNLCLYGLAKGQYAMRAFIDSNTNGVRDAWESWGYANMSGAAGVPRFDVRMIAAASGPRLSPVTIFIQDCDTDNDFYPDVWEFERNAASAVFLTLSGPASEWPNPALTVP